MDNKFKTSKYAAIILASTMALSTVASVTPQAFGEKGITAHAEEATASDVSSKIGEISIADLTTLAATGSTTTKYEAAVTVAVTAYDSLSSVEKAKVKAGDLKVLNAHKAITKDTDSLEALKALPKEADLTSNGTLHDGTTGDVYTEYSIGDDGLADVEPVTVKGKTTNVGINKKFKENVVDKVTAFKTAYDKIIGANKDAKSILATKYKEYTTILKAVTAKQKLIAGSYDAKTFDKLYEITQKGTKDTPYPVKESEPLKISKKGEFTIDSDKYTAAVVDGKLKITAPNGKDISSEYNEEYGTIEIYNRDDDGLTIEPDGSADTIRVAGKKYTMTKGTGTEPLVTFTDVAGNAIKSATATSGETTVTIDDREYNVKETSFNSTPTYKLTTTATDATYYGKYSIDYKSGIKVKRVLGEATIATPTTGAAIKLRNLNKSLSVAEYKKYKAGKEKYSDNELKIINLLEEAYKATSKDGKKTISAEEVTNYKAYVADAKTQASLEKKVTSQDAKGVTNQINKLKYSNDLEAYEESIKDARSAYDQLSKKYKKKIKSSVLEKLTGQEKAVVIMKKINNIPVADLLDKIAAADVEQFKKDKVDPIAKTVKGNRAGGTGEYYDTDNFPKKARSYVKNFKDIAAINKVIDSQIAYLKQKTTVDKFETELTKLTDAKTLRIVNNYVKLDTNVYKITTDKASKAVTLTPVLESSNLAPHTINSGAPVKLTADDLAAKEYKGTKTIAVDNAEYQVTYSNNSVSLKKGDDNAITPTNGEIEIASKKYKVAVNDKKLTLTQIVENEVNEGTKSVATNNTTEIKLNGIDYKVTATASTAPGEVAGFYAGEDATAPKTLATGDTVVKNGKTYEYKAADAVGTGSAAGFYAGTETTPLTLTAGDKIVHYDKTYTYRDVKQSVILTPTQGTTVTVSEGTGKSIGAKKYTVSVKNNVATFVDEFDSDTISGKIVTNTKGKVSIASYTAPASNNATSTDVIDFKGVSVATFIDPKTDKYTTTQVQAIQAATKEYTTASGNKEAKKYINKEDTTAIKNYEKALKNQLALEKKALDNYNKTLKFSTDLTAKTTGGTTISQYELDALAAEEALEDFGTRYNTEKAKAVASYNTKFTNHKAASKVATAVALLPKSNELTVDTYSIAVVGAPTGKTKEDLIKEAKKDYGDLNLDQKKLATAGLEIINTAEKDLETAKAQDAIIGTKTATAADYVTVGYAADVVTDANVAAFNKAAKAAADNAKSEATKASKPQPSKAEQFVEAKKAIDTAIAAHKVLDGKSITVNTANPTKLQLSPAILLLDSASTKNALITSAFTLGNGASENDITNIDIKTKPSLDAEGEIEVTLLADDTSKYTANIKLKLVASSDEKTVESKLRATTSVEIANGKDTEAEAKTALVTALQGIAGLTTDAHKALITADSLTVDLTGKTVTVTLPTGTTVTVKFTVAAAAGA